MFHKSMAVIASLLLVSSVASADPMFVNSIAVPGNMGDQFGTSVNDGRLGMFSDLYYDPVRNEWWGLSDRGPGGGTLAYDTRVQRFAIDIDPITGAISHFRVVATIKFSNGGPRRTMNGKAPDPTNALQNALDPEGFVVSPEERTLFGVRRIRPVALRVQPQRRARARVHHTGQSDST